MLKRTYYDTFRDKVGTYAPKTSLKWSNELGLSASIYMDKLDGCSVYEPTLLNTGDFNKDLKTFAAFDNH